MRTRTERDSLGERKVPAGADDPGLRRDHGRKIRLPVRGGRLPGGGWDLLNARIGYERAAELFKNAVERRTTVSRLALEKAALGPGRWKN